MSSVDISPLPDKLESIYGEQGNDFVRRRRTTVASICPVYTSGRLNNYKKSNSIDEYEDDELTTQNENGRTSLIGMDEEALKELVELSQKIDSTL